MKPGQMNSTSLFLLVLPILLAGCLPEGYMRTWSTDQPYDRQFKNLMIMGLVEDVSLRNQLEMAVVDQADRVGLQSRNGLSMFPPELGKPFEDVERFRGRLREKGFDGILTITLIDVKAERYTEPQVTYEPLIFYNKFGNYYFRTYDLVYQKGYVTRYSRYFLETNFYELNEGKLIWSGRSAVFEPETIDAFSVSYARGLFRELFQENVIGR